MSDEAFSGVCLLVRPDKRIVRTFGNADRAAGLPWTLHTRSQVASISKQFVAACALILVDRGLLDLDDAVSRHLAAADTAWDGVSLRQLLTHTSGMSHWSDQPGFDPSISTPVDERLHLFLAAPRPGRSGSFRYSSPGYVVLSAVLAAAASRRYEELVRELVITPLGLAETHLVSPGSVPLALGYRQGEPVASWDLGTMPGTGDLWATADDLAQFVSALHSGGLLPPAAQSLLHGLGVATPPSRVESRIRSEKYVAGHFVGTVDGRPACLHPGDNPGYQSLAVWLPDTLTTLVLLSNEESDDLEMVAVEALRDFRS